MPKGVCMNYGMKCGSYNFKAASFPCGTVYLASMSSPIIAVGCTDATCIAEATQFQAVYSPYGQPCYVGDNNLYYMVPHFSPLRLTVTAEEMQARRLLRPR